MKKLILSVALGFATIVGVTAQEISFDKEVQDYGTIAKGVEGTKSFAFTNTGEAPLLIKSVKPSCGCTVADYPKNAIAPGESAEITVGYDTKRVGAFSKSIEVYSNSVDNARKILRIKGKVEGEK